MGKRRSFTVQIGVTSYVVTAEYDAADHSTGTPEGCVVSSVTHDGEEISDSDFELLADELTAGWLLAHGEDHAEARWAAQGLSTLDEVVS